MRRVLALVCVFCCASLPAWSETFLVLPFANLSDNSNIDWIGESISESISDALAAEGMIVLDRDDREEVYRRLSLRQNSNLTKASVIKVGETLDAATVVFGVFDLEPHADGQSKTMGTLRISAQMLQLSRKTAGPEYAETGALAELAHLQSRLAWRTLQFAAPDRAPSEEEYRKQNPVVRVEAIEHYIRGLLAQTPEAHHKFFTQAVRLEPTYSQANFQLGSLELERENYKAASAHLQKVAKGDLRYRQARFLLGLARYKLRDFAGAEQCFRLVAEAVPLNEVLNNLAAAQARKNAPEALENFQKALEGDPNDPDYHFNVGYTLFRHGELEEAAEEFRAVLDRDPEDAEAITMLGRCLKPPVKRGTLPSQGLERLKHTYEETAYLQLKAVLESKQ